MTEVVARESAEQRPSEEELLFGDPDWTQMAALRGRLALQHSRMIDATIDRAKIVGYPACRERYEQWLGQHIAAECHLFGAMGCAKVPVPANGNDSTTTTAWRFTAPATEGPLEGIPLAHRVQVTSDAQGRIGAPNEEKPAITVTTHVVHTPQHEYTDGDLLYFTGEMIGGVAFTGNAQTNVLPTPLCKPRTFEELFESVCAELTAPARAEALAPYVPALMRFMGEEDREPKRWQYYSLHYTGYMLAGATTDEATALKWLIKGFSPEGVAEFQKLHRFPLNILTEELVAQGAIDRFAWLADMSTEIRLALRDKIRAAVTFGFAGAFEAKMALEVPKTDVLRAVTAQLCRMVRIDHCKPTPHRPAVLQLPKDDKPAGL